MAGLRKDAEGGPSRKWRWLALHARRVAGRGGQGRARRAPRKKDDRTHFFGWFFERFYGVDEISRGTHGELLRWTRNVAMQASPKATLACAGAFSSTDFRPDLPRFRVPTLIVHGNKDVIVPIEASARAAAAGIADATLIECDDAPHGLIATHKRRLTDDLLEFLRKA